MITKLSRFLTGVLEAGWLVAVISVPLFFNIHSERVFEPDKISILRSIAVLMLFAWVVRFIDQGDWRDWKRLSWSDEDSIWKTPFFLPIFALVFVYFISSLFSITPRISWLGSYQRMQGTYTMLAYLVYFVAVVTTINGRLQVKRIPTAVIITSIPIAFYGVIQHFGLDPLPWGGDVIARVAGNMGNAIFIAAYLIMVVPLTLGRIIDAFTNILVDEHLSYADVTRSAVYIFVLAIQLLAIYWSGSRGPLIGLAVALFSFILVLLVSLRNLKGEDKSFSPIDALFALLPVIPPIIFLMLSGIIGNIATPMLSFIVFLGTAALSIGLMLLLVLLRKGWGWLWLSWLLLTTFLAIWLLIFNIPTKSLERAAEMPMIGGMFEEQIIWKELPQVGSYGRMLDPSQNRGREKSNRVRVLIWQGVVDLISPHSPLNFPDGSTDRFNFWRPIIGYGPESMYVAYNRFYPAELATVEARNASPDRSHNETFDALVITGLAGLLAWQVLYLMVFYYGFNYLGVVRTRRDLWVLIGAWIGGAFLGAILSVTLFDPIYLGVAIPTGTILGLVFYLFYYALFNQPSASNSSVPAQFSLFQADHLLVNALLAAVLAHYVEVHFGIAVASTRLHFFLYIALISVIAYKLPQDSLSINGRISEKTRQSRYLTSQKESVWGSVLGWTFLLALLIGTMGYNFVNYVLPADKSIETGTDLQAWNILYQSLFVNPQRNFVDSPFIFVMVLLSWVLGVLILLSERIRQMATSLKIPSVTKLSPTRSRLVFIGFLTLGLLGLAQRFLFTPSPGSTGVLVRSLFLFGGIISLWVAWSFIRTHDGARLAGLVVVIVGLLMVMPLLITGMLAPAIILAVICGTLLYLLWDPEFKPIVLPPILLALASLTIGLIYTYFHALLLREVSLYLLFLQGIEPLSTLFRFVFRPSGQVTNLEQARLLEARQVIRLISFYYLFLFTMLILAGYTFAGRSIALVRSRGRSVAFAGAIMAMILITLLIHQTNLKPVQADMLFKRGRPFDEVATQDQNPLLWNVAIAIYEEALRMVPFEDYYYLFLGRALLERSAVAETKEEQLTLLTDAESRLIEARDINPLNTDHTANLARLNARWAVSSDDPDQRVERLDRAESYYRSALEISPQNSVIRNEYARLAFDLGRDCDLAIDIFRESLAHDPFYAATFFSFSDVLASCAEAQSVEAEAQELYQYAIESLEAGLSIEPEQARAWLLLGQINQRLTRFGDALEAFEQARQLNEQSGMATWNLDFLEAAVYREMGDISRSRAMAEQALQTAPTDIALQIEEFLDTLE
jgi:tetratricopeptide (TPR) repeat protein